MPYRTKQELPEGVQNSLPLHGQDIYRKAYNSALKQYKDDLENWDTLEQRAHRVAWGAVKRAYAKGSDGRWRRTD